MVDSGKIFEVSANLQLVFESEIVCFLWSHRDEENWDNYPRNMFSMLQSETVVATVEDIQRCQCKSGWGQALGGGR